MMDVEPLLCIIYLHPGRGLRSHAVVYPGPSFRFGVPACLTLLTPLVPLIQDFLQLWLLVVNPAYGWAINGDHR
jgi:hypothetical protein